VHDAEHRGALAQQCDRDRRPALALQEFARAVLRVDQPTVTCKRACGKTSFLAEKIAGYERLQPFAQPLFDLRVDRRLAA
jgi:hypothetical protein